MGKFLTGRNEQTAGDKKVMHTLIFKISPLK
jgi:hypothetical protein